MNFFKSIKERIVKGSEFIKSKIKRAELSSNETTESKQVNNNQSGDYRSNSSSSKQQKQSIKQLMTQLKNSNQKGKDLLNFVLGRTSKDIEKAVGEAVNKMVEASEGSSNYTEWVMTDVNEMKRQRALSEEDRNFTSLLSNTNAQLFKDLQAKRNEAIIDLEEKLEDWEKAIAADNGLLEMDMIPYSLLTEEELSERIEEYERIIDDAETEVRKKLVKGYDDFLNMIIHTILPDMNPGFLETLKEEFKNADLIRKSDFLETWWEEMRLLYDDLHTGTETLWGLEIQQSVAESMLEFLRNGKFERSWDVESASSYGDFYQRHEREQRRKDGTWN